MTHVTEKQVLDALLTIIDEERGASIVDLGMVTNLRVNEGRVVFALQVEPERGPQLEPLRKAAEDAVKAIPGVGKVTAILTADRPAAKAPQPQPDQRAGNLDLPHLKTLIAVASGKGGVGKSTVSANLALALAAKGLRVGVLDADIYGPSMPRMLGITGKPTSPDGKTIDPLENHGVKSMSMGYMVDEEDPIIWRGPMVMSALEQLLKDVNWGELDVLVLDLPPGTGDAQLTLAQKVPLTGAVIVSTPQDIALADARKGLNMFRKVNVPVLGIVENMSYFVCPHCGERTEIFSHGGAEREAERLDVEFLGAIPLDIRIRETSDGGTPIVVAEPDSPHTAAFKAIADRVWEQASASVSGSGPKIVIE